MTRYFRLGGLLWTMRGGCGTGTYDRGSNPSRPVASMAGPASMKNPESPSARCRKSGAVSIPLSALHSSTVCRSDPECPDPEWPCDSLHAAAGALCTATVCRSGIGQANAPAPKTTKASAATSERGMGLRNRRCILPMLELPPGGVNISKRRLDLRHRQSNRIETSAKPHLAGWVGAGRNLS